jgi:Trypsin-like peptidase domain
MGRALNFILAGSFACVMGAETVQVQADPVSDIEQSLAYIEVIATSIADDGKELPQAVLARGTGFVVSNDGFILTSNHLIKNLPAFKKGSLQIRAGIGPDGARHLDSVESIKSDAAYDLLLLKAPSDTREYFPVTFASSSEMMDLRKSATLKTKGFQRPEDPTKQATITAPEQGTLSNLNGAPSHFWMVSTTINAGQSGSPFFLENGEVVGIASAKSLINDDTFFVVPAYFADSLLSHIRFAQLQAQIDSIKGQLGEIKEGLPPIGARLENAETDLSDIGNYLSWSGSFDKDSLKIDFQKLVADGVTPEKIKASVKPVAFDENNIEIALGEYPKTIEKLIYVDGSLTGTFLFQKLRGSLERDLCEKNAARISELDVKIIATVRNSAGDAVNREAGSFVVKTNLKKSECVDPDA